MKSARGRTEPKSARAGVLSDSRHIELAERVRALLAASSHEAILEAVADGVYRLARLTSATVLTVSEDGRALSVAAHQGRHAKPAMAKQIPLDGELLERLLPPDQTQAWITIEGLESKLSLLGVPTRALGRTALATLWCDRSLQAVLVAMGAKGASLVGVQDPYVAHFVTVASVAICRAREIEDLRHRLGLASSLITMDEVLESAASYGDSMRRLLERVQDIIGAESVSMMMYDPITDAMVLQQGSVPHQKLGEDEESVIQMYHLPLSGGGIVVGVFHTGRPYFSNSPSQDPNALKHWLEYFGTRNMICVPVEAGGRRIGTLSITNKRAGDFSDRDFQLAIILASHLGLLVQNAKLLQSERDSAASLRDANAALDGQNRRVQRLLEAHDELTGHVLMGRGVEHIVATLHRLLANPVVVVDRFANVIGCAPTPGRAGGAGDPGRPFEVEGSLPTAAARPQVRALLAEADLEGKAVRLPASPDVGLETPWIVAPIPGGHEVVGHAYVAESARSLDETDVMMLERGCISIGLQMLREQAAVQAQYRLRGDFVSELLSGGASSVEAVRTRSGYLGIDLRVPRSVLVIRSGLQPSSSPDADLRGAGPGSDSMLQEIVGRLLRHSFREDVLATKGQELIVLAKIGAKGEPDRADEAWRLANEFLAEIARWLPELEVLVGIGKCADDVSAYSWSYRQARIALQVAEMSGKHQGAIRYEQLGIYGILFGSEDRDGLNAQMRGTIGALLDHDHVRQGSLTTTLDRYLENSCNLRATASDLGVHPNTVRHRLARAEEILHLDFGSLEVKLGLAFALRIWHVLGEAQAHPAA